MWGSRGRWAPIRQSQLPSMSGQDEALATARITRSPVSTITINRFINLGLGLTEEVEADRGWGTTTGQGERGDRGSTEGDYVVFPRSIFFWMARAEW